MKIKLKDVKRIIKEEIEKQRDKIVQIAIDAAPTPEVEIEREMEEIPESRKEGVESSVDALDEELSKLVQQAMEEEG